MYQTLIKPALDDIKTFVLDTLFPISCLSCEKEGTFICDDCKGTLKKLENQKCIVCQKAAIFGLTHSGCLTPHSADGLISFYDYHDKKVAKIIIQGKYYFLPEVYKILGAIIAEKIKNDFPYLLQATNYYLTPIPLHPFRKRWRGFNQAEILVESLSQSLNLPSASVLVRCKQTKTQKDLNKEQRAKNIDGAFAINTKLPSPIHGEGSGEMLSSGDSIRGKNFLLVDDVTTTGATLQEAAKVLKRNGAAKVICLTVARD